MVEERFSPPGFSMPLALKDIRLALAAGDRLGVPLPVGSLLRDILLSGIGRGLGGLDWSALARVAAENAGAR
jgi:3-hydroxyisobutyrate dehydrogenase-like beta-hydroxyacid dehydrogenase